MPGSVGPLEIVVVLAIALIVLGPKRLPEVARSVGRGIREFRESVSGITSGTHDDRDDEEHDDVAALPPSQRP